MLKKRFTSLFLALAMVLGLSGQAFATEIPVFEYINVDGYSFKVSETVDPNYVTTRTYRRAGSKTRTISDAIEAKALLKTLGISDDLVAEMDENALQEYINAESIVVSVAYTKRDELTGEITYLPQEQAISESKLIQEQFDEYILSGDLSALATAQANSPVTKVYKDSYMKVTHTIIYTGNGGYTFKTDAEWLTMPLFRGYDSLGSCATMCAYVPDSGSGYYEYKTVTVTNSVASKPVPSGRFYISNSNIKSAVKDGTTGMMATFILPGDTLSGDTDNQIFRQNFTAHFEYKGKISQPDIRNTFNSNGTYTHSTVRLTVNPSASINSNGGSASIGFGLAATTEKRTAEAIVDYVP